MAFQKKVCVCVCVVCVCVCWVGERRCLSQDPSLLKNAKESLLPQLPLLPPAARSRPPRHPPTPNPESQALGGRAPLPSPLGSVRAPKWRTVLSLDGRPRGQVVSLQGLDRPSGPSPFKLALSVPAAPRRASGLGSAEPRRGRAGAPPTDPGAQTGAGERSATRDLEPPRGC